jgi:4-cresol dehydrogenase (hydroxylating)
MPIDSAHVPTAALDAWRAALGDGAVAADAATIERYARTTQAGAPRPSCILYPKNTREVQALVRIASDHGTVVYPISCGKNWGYGDACAPVEGAAIVDLGRMNRILEVHRDLAYCVIEPGVTQGQLFAHLRDTKSGLWMDATAAGPDSSLVGNTADRGFGHTRYGDHFLTCSGMEIVLADGRVLNTGFGHFPGARATHCYPYGVGPYLDGLFTQSNYGIITKIGLWLMPEPEAFTFFFLRARQFDDFEQVIERLRPLRLNGTLNTAIHIGNDLRVLAGSGKYPWELAGGVAPLPPHVREHLRKISGAQAWQGSGSLSGTRAQVRAGKHALRKALHGVATVRFVTDRNLGWLEGIHAALSALGQKRRFERMLKILRPNFDLLKGVPTIEPVMGANWRLRKPPERPGDPLDSGVGLYWVSPVMPMRGGDAMRVLNLARPIFEAHGFDFVVSMILLTERSLVAIMNIAFDKSVPEECTKASACYEALLDALLAAGYPIYRSGLQGMPKLRAHESVFWDIATEIKRALDPKDIIARGRYIAPLE